MKKNLLHWQRMSDVNSTSQDKNIIHLVLSVFHYHIDNNVIKDQQLNCFGGKPLCPKCSYIVSLKTILSKEAQISYPKVSFVIK
jgi:hypothetical protein